jgi:hypothetical protein
MRTLCLLLLATTLMAQKLPLPDGSGRVLQLFDVQTFLPKPGTAPATELQKIADVMARFLEPSLGPGDDFKALGDRWLALLGSPEQIAAAERLFRLAKERRERLIDLDVQLFGCDDKAFAKLKARLVQVERDQRVTYENVFGKQDAHDFADAVAKTAATQLVAQKLTVFPLQRANVAVKNQTSYVKDFTITKNDKDYIADPVVDIVWDGNETEVLATFLPDGTLGIACDVVLQEVEKPIAEYKTTVAGSTLPVTIQLPRLTATRLTQAAVLAEGSLEVLAARKLDGSWLLALVSAQARPQ